MWSSRERAAHGKPVSRANVIALPSSASSRNAAQTWPSRAALAPIGSSPELGGLSSTVGPSAISWTGKGKRLFLLIFDFSSGASSSFQGDKCEEGPSQLLALPGCSVSSSFASPKHCPFNPRLFEASFPPKVLEVWEARLLSLFFGIVFLPGEGSSDVSASKTAQVSPLLLGFPSPQLQKTGQEGWCAAAQPARLWPCGATPNPGRQRGGGGLSEGRAWGEEAGKEDEREVDPG